MSIAITVPNDDHVALRAMAKALEEIAVARGAPEQSTQIGEMEYEISIDPTRATAALEELMKQVELDTTTQQVESLAIPVEANGATYETDLGSDKPEAVCVADSNGTPWDERIHSASKALNSDGTWRLRRKPADKTPEEWTAYVKWVEEDIHTVLHGQSEDSEEWEKTKQPDHMEPSVTPEGDDFHVDVGEVTEQQVVAIPAPPLPVPQLGGSFAQSAPHKLVGSGDDLSSGAGVTPQTRTTVGSSGGGGAVVSMTFPQVMQFLTERHGRITSAQVDDIIADMGLNSIMDLNTQPEHTGPFIARVKALLGE